MVFDALNEVKRKAEPLSKSDGEFFISVGDNLYPVIDEEPTNEEFNTVMSLFQRPSLSHLDVWAIRGNHDCYFDQNFQINKTNEYS
jgi:hypothetical protein